MQKYNIENIVLNQTSIPTKLLTSYKMIGLSENELVIILHIHRFLQAGVEFPTPAQLSTYMNASEHTCAQTLRSLIQKSVLKIIETRTNNEAYSETYSLQPLWEKLFTEEPYEVRTEEDISETNEGTLFVLFEQEFGRPLSPFEIETISIWLDEDHMKPALIKAALREAVLIGTLNFKYIDRILRNWKQKGVQSVEQARNIGKHFRENQEQQYSTEKRDTSFYYNWLEEDD